ncbi:hypothetical protein OC846_003534 [Tilletia horrida]|uniref:DFDF domain-containing protein n=1 Tax=Tilletia horrida TaxID=155126 RepID=A0AAN6JRM6_9BASI|nr:hypothetical protein OC846_003534 [Tilletia horrida]KAK0565915.1 hypothetical protein OC861_003503 [Tilletia horrida]
MASSQPPNVNDGSNSQDQSGGAAAATGGAGHLIGALISLISRSDIRYQGLLAQVDPAQATISLEKVRSWGTEGRLAAQNRAHDEIPPNANLYEYIVFRAADVKDLKIDDPSPPKHQPPPPPPPQFHDPAILGSSGPPGPGPFGGPMGRSPFGPPGYDMGHPQPPFGGPPPPPGAFGPPGGGPRGFGPPGPGPFGMPSPGAPGQGPPPPGPPQQQQPPPSLQPASAQPAPAPAQTTATAPPASSNEPAKDAESTSAAPSEPAPAPPVLAAAPTAAAVTTPANAAPAATSAQAQQKHALPAVPRAAAAHAAAQQHQQQHLGANAPGSSPPTHKTSPAGGRGGRGGGRGGGPGGRARNQELSAQDSANGASVFRQTRHASNHRNGGPGPISGPDLNEEFDFESANARFQKEKLALQQQQNGGSADEGATVNDSNGASALDTVSTDLLDSIPPAPAIPGISPGALYDKKASFFDDISSEVKERYERPRGGGRGGGGGRGRGGFRGGRGGGGAGNFDAELGGLGNLGGARANRIAEERKNLMTFGDTGAGVGGGFGEGGRGRGRGRGRGGRGRGGFRGGPPAHVTGMRG